MRFLERKNEMRDGKLLFTGEKKKQRPRRLIGVLETEIPKICPCAMPRELFGVGVILERGKLETVTFLYEVITRWGENITE